MSDVWFEGRETKHVLFVEEDLKFVLRLLSEAKGNSFAPGTERTEREKTAERVMTRILVQQITEGEMK